MTTPATPATDPPTSAAVPAPRRARPLTLPPSSAARARGEQAMLAVFVVVPFLAVLAAVPLLWGRWITWRDVIVSAVMYAITGHGVTVGFHRYFTHGAFKAGRAVRVALAVAGSMAIEGPVVRWVADHRRHHAFSDAEGDPHSPWRYGNDLRALVKGFWHAHIGWLFDTEQTDQRRFAPDLLADRDIRRVSRLFAPLSAASLALPALIGGLWGWSWEAAAQTFFWAGLVRVAVLHHVTWSTNSICHLVGRRPFASRDRAANVWPLALLSMGESWHNLHHADPTCARHGVLRGQVDTSARVIAVLEGLGLAWDVRWPTPERIAAKTAAPA